MGTYDTDRSAARDGRRARHAAHVEVRALGHRPARPRHVRRVERRRREPVQHLRSPRHVRDRLSRAARRADAARDPRAGRGPHHRRGLLDRDRARAGARVRRRAAREHVGLPAHEPRSPASPATRAARATGCSPPTAASTRSAQPRFHGGMHGRPLAAPIVGMAPTPIGQRLLAGRAATAASSASATPRFFGSTGGDATRTRRCSGMTPTATGQRLLALRARRRHLQLRRRAVLRLDRQHPAQPARRVDGRAAAGRRLLDDRRATAASSRSAGAVRGVGRERADVRRRTSAMLPSTTGNGYVMLRERRPVVDVRRRAEPRRRGGRVFGRAVGIAGRLKPFS